MHRIKEVDRQIRENEYPNRSKFSKDWGSCKRTFDRDLEFLHSLGADLVYDPGRKGYCYANKEWHPAFLLPVLDKANQLQGLSKQIRSLIPPDLRHLLIEVFKELSLSDQKIILTTLILSFLDKIDSDEQARILTQQLKPLSPSVQKRVFDSLRSRRPPARTSGGPIGLMTFSSSSISFFEPEEKNAPNIIDQLNRLNDSELKFVINSICL